MTAMYNSVVCRGLIPARVKMTSRRRVDARFRTPTGASLLGCVARGLFVSVYDGRVVTSRSGTDSDLEAFSHNPADGSFAAMPDQTAAKTNYLNQVFLSY
jgi:hypothetical protein